jgi:hypothetical protein
MNAKKCFPFLLAVLLASCVPVMSLHPLYDDKHIVFEEKLLGIFAEPNDITWEFARSEDPNAYILTYATVSEKDRKVLKGLFVAHLVKLDGRLFLDVFPKEAPWADDAGLDQTKWPFNSFFMLPVHTFLKVGFFETQLKLWLTDDDNLKKLLKEDPNAVRNESVEDKPVLTAPTQELQSFVLKYADDSQLFPSEHILTRKTSEPVKDVNQPKNSEPNTNDIPADANGMPV